MYLSARAALVAAAGKGGKAAKKALKELQVGAQSNPRGPRVPICIGMGKCVGWGH